MTEKFRADQIGSLLRPEALLAARRGHDAGTVTDAGLNEAEDQAITAAVRRQQETGIDVVTDGEFRRRDFRSGFAQAVDGIEMSAWDMPWLIADGVRYIQLDNPGYGAYLGGHAGHDPAGFERVLSADIAAVLGVERPAGVTIGLHVCRGNQSSKWMGEDVARSVWEDDGPND